MTHSDKQHHDGAAVSRIEQKLKLVLDAQNFYEAHQLYRTLYSRYCASGKFSQLQDMLYDGISRLIDAQQLASAGDLSLLFVEVLKKSDTSKIDSKIVYERLAKFFTGILKGGKDLEPVRDKFDQEVFTWIGTEPALHLAFGHCLWKAEQFSLARRHFMLADDSNALGNFLIDYHTKEGKPDECDLFLTQALMQLLCRHKESIAGGLFDVYTKHHPLLSGKNEKEDGLQATPLLDFDKLLLESVKHGQLGPFSFLVEKYQTSLERDPAFRTYLDKIGQLYFGLPPPPAPPSSFLASLVKDMLKSDDDVPSVAPQLNGNASEKSIPEKEHSTKTAEKLHEEDLD